MSIFGTPLGMNVKDNPLVFSPYDQGESDNIYPFGSEEDLVTEGGVFILTEGNDFLTTE
jgi:hypothetical protein